MKHLKSFNESIEESDIDSICKKYNITNYTINIDGSIDVDGNVYLDDKKLTKLPIKFNIVSGYFNCSSNQLTTLEGSPKEVGGNFDCSNNNLTSLQGCPSSVGGDFYCSYNNKFMISFPLCNLIYSQSFNKATFFKRPSTAFSSSVPSKGLVI